VNAIPHRPAHEAPRRRRGRSQRRKRALSVAAITAIGLGISLTLLLDARAVATPAATAASPAVPATDVSRFEHTEPQHARLPCLLCHQRTSNTPEPKLPGHTPCAGCHEPQFASPGSFCTICHTDPQSGAVKRFPRLRSFDVAFDHAKHARGAARPRSGCAACHKPARRGVALSIPAGRSAHTTCFACHSPRAESAGRDISSCGVCHRVGRHTPTPVSARAFAMNFSHAEHARAGLQCASCHDVRAGAAKGRQVTSPVPAQHHAPARARSCMNCHDGKRAFGGDDFSVCTRCHEGNTWHF
jgi:c(7)-type cytochrome triheme protein